MTGPATPPESSTGISFNGKPILGTLVLIAVVNWFVCFGISLYWGGDATSVLPSQEGFGLKSHGNRRAVSESTWVFSLFYSTATLLGTPAIILPIVLWHLNKQKQNAKPQVKLLVGLFVSLWVILWCAGLGSDFYRSWSDWQKMKQHKPESLFPSPNARTNVNQ